MLAERLAPTDEGAALSVQLWVQLLNARANDADGWTLLAEALKHERRLNEASWADGLGAWLTQGQPPSTELKYHHISSLGDFAFEPPPGAVLLTVENMPHLFRHLGEVTLAFGHAPMRVLLDVDGGAVAYLTSPSELVLGAGALAVFSSQEMSCLVALALCLGVQGQNVMRASSKGEAVDAAVIEQAFEATRTTLPLGRVLTVLELGEGEMLQSRKDIVKLTPSERLLSIVSATVLRRLS
jgi:hypothetical protein